MKSNFKSILMLVLLIAVVLVATSVFTLNLNKDDKFVYSDLLELFEADLVRDFVVNEKGEITLNAYIVTKADDGSYVFELDEKGERKVKELEYSFSYELQIDKVVEIVDANAADCQTNLVEYEFMTTDGAFWQAYLRPSP